MAIYGEMRLGWDRARADAHAHPLDTERVMAALPRRVPGRFVW